MEPWFSHHEMSSVTASALAHCKGLAPRPRSGLLSQRLLKGAVGPAASGPVSGSIWASSSAHTCKKAGWVRAGGTPAQGPHSQESCMQGATLRPASPSRVLQRLRPEGRPRGSLGPAHSPCFSRRPLHVGVWPCAAPGTRLRLRLARRLAGRVTSRQSACLGKGQKSHFGFTGQLQR